MSAKNFSMHVKFGGKVYHPGSNGAISKAPRKAAMTASQINPSKNAATLPGTEKISKTGFWYNDKKSGQRKWKEMGASYGKRRPRKKSNIVPSKL